MSPSASEQPSQFPRPLRKVYAYLLAASVLVRLPWWILTSLTSWQRPRRSWTLKQALTAKFIRWVFGTFGSSDNRHFVTYSPSHERLEKGYGGVWVEGTPPEFVTGKLGDWASKAGVGPIKIPGYWIHKRGAGNTIAVGQEPLSPKEKVVYFLHGGAYTLCSAHPSQVTSNIPKGILKYCQDVKRSFAVEYRLSSIPPERTSGQFPSALLDALSGYVYLVDRVGFKPEQIVVVGDSAGGNLAQALVRYLAEYKGVVPNLPDVPGALILLSPWVDMSGSHHGANSSIFANRDSDYIITPLLPNTNDAPRAFIEPFGLEFASETPYISPACKTLVDVRFDGFPRTFISAGDAEVLVDQIRALVRRMKENLGEENVVYLEAKDAFHDCIVMTHSEPWKSQILTAIADFIRQDESELEA